ncbi:hypothetical protein [Frankia sp. CcI49]|uniref:hypothetical protein n=1 Tax=Frankia sp. CcI49 TaxID=1745382 RepID=UPI0013040B3F|nr:hypothetical protein [Frankia sp. CcI49]
MAVVDLHLAAGIGRDELIATLLERVPADARLTHAATFGDEPDHLLTWETDPSA